MRGRGLAMADDADLIAAIYDCIIDPSRWEEVVKRIVEATKSVSGALITQRVHASESAALCNIDPFYADAYAQHYCKIRPFRGIGGGTRSGRSENRHLPYPDRCFQGLGVLQ
jgi:hypothetical protein